MVISSTLVILVLKTHCFCVSLNVLAGESRRNVADVNHILARVNWNEKSVKNKSVLLLRRTSTTSDGTEAFAVLFSRTFFETLHSHGCSEPLRNHISCGEVFFPAPLRRGFSQNKPSRTWLDGIGVPGFTSSGWNRCRLRHKAATNRRGFRLTAYYRNDTLKVHNAAWRDIASVDAGSKYTTERARPFQQSFCSSHERTEIESGSVLH